MILLIDNYDSFTHNLFHTLNKNNRYIKIVRNDEISVKDIKILNPKAIVISPGPKSPKEAGICLETIKTFYRDIPILGVCLGHQSIGEAFGGNVIKAKKLMHGKTSPIKHSEDGIFEGVSQDTVVARYHSLAVDPTTLPDKLVVTATTNNGEIMAMKHCDYPVVGVQFHPESLFTTEGETMINNFFKEIEEAR